MTPDPFAPAAGLRLAIFTDTFPPNVNGVARTIERLARAIESRGGTVHVETVSDPEAAPDAMVHRHRSRPFWAYPSLRVALPSGWAATRRLARFNPTLVHVATPFGVGLAGRIAARRLGVPLVTSYHTTFPQYLSHYGLDALDRVVWPYLRWFHNRGLRTFVPSTTVERELRWQGFGGLRVWGRGVDTLRFAPTWRSLAARRAIGAREGDFVIAYVGRLAPEKRIATLLDAVRLLRSRFGDRIRLAIAGDGPAATAVRAAAPPDTHFAGMLAGEALSAFYASADCFAFPSDSETFGNVILEAMASGLPVVAPDRGATTEIASSSTAVLFRGGDAESMANALARLLVDPALRVSLQTHGRLLAEGRSWETVWDRLLADYDEVRLRVPREGRQVPTAARTAVTAIRG